MDNEYILFRLQAGDIKILGEVYQKLYQTLYSLAFHLLRDENEARDAVQETFARLCKVGKGWKGVRDVRWYVIGAVRNQCYRIIEERNRKLSNKLEYSRLILDEAIEAEANERNMNAHRDLMLEIILNSLPKKRRRIVRLFYYENLSYREIAELLELTKDTIKTQLRLARIQFHEFKNLIGTMLILIAFLQN